MKTDDELNALKKEVEALNGKLAELTEEELSQVSGGTNVLLLDFIRKLSAKYFDLTTDTRNRLDDIAKE